MNAQNQTPFLRHQEQLQGYISSECLPDPSNYADWNKLYSEFFNNCEGNINDQDVIEKLGAYYFYHMADRLLTPRKIRFSNMRFEKINESPHIDVSDMTPDKAMRVYNMTRIVRVNQFFLGLNSLLGYQGPINYLYFNSEKARKAMLTSGLIIEYFPEKGPLGTEYCTMVDFQSLSPSEKGIWMGKVMDFMKGFQNNHKSSEEKRDEPVLILWPGCEMSIPDYVQTIIDPHSQMMHLEIYKKKNPELQENPDYQILIEEQPSTTTYSVLGTRNVFSKDANYTMDSILSDDSKAKPIETGYSVRVKPRNSQVFCHFITEIKDFDPSKHDIFMHLPIVSPSYDVLSQIDLEISQDAVKKGGKKVDILCASST